jgi:hypothetical protein
MAAFAFATILGLGKGGGKPAWRDPSRRAVPSRLKRSPTTFKFAHARIARAAALSRHPLLRTCPPSATEAVSPREPPPPVEASTSVPPRPVPPTATLPSREGEPRDPASARSRSRRAHMGNGMWWGPDGPGRPPPRAQRQMIDDQRIKGGFGNRDPRIDRTVRIHDDAEMWIRADATCAQHYDYALVVDARVSFRRGARTGSPRSLAPPPPDRPGRPALTHAPPRRASWSASPYDKEVIEEYVGHGRCVYTAGLLPCQG